MKGFFKGNYERVMEYVKQVKDAEGESLQERMELQRDIMRSLDTDDEYELFERHVTLLEPKEYDMGLNSDPWSPNWKTLVEGFKALVEADGMARASWSCEGRTRHEMHSRQLAAACPEYEFDIDYSSYRCIAYKK